MPPPSFVFGSVPHAPQNLIYSDSLANFPTSAPVSCPEKFSCSECFLTSVAYPTNLPASRPVPPLLAALRWWNEFLAVYNGVSLLRSSPQIETTVRFCTDTCISGIGGFFDGRVFRSSYSPFIDTALLSIASLEMLAVIVSLKLWSEELRGQRILLRTDNQNTEIAINTGHSRVPFVQSCLRELRFYAFRFDFELRALYIPGHQNTIADSLSRWDNDPQYQHI